MTIREVISRKINFDSPKGKMVLKKDMIAILEYLDTLSPYPWTPKQCMKIQTSRDLDFVSKSPEVIEYLVNIIMQMLNDKESQNDE